MQSFFFLFFDRERERARTHMWACVQVHSSTERQWERERENPKQAPCSAESLEGAIPPAWALDLSWNQELDTQPTEPTRHPNYSWGNANATHITTDGSKKDRCIQRHFLAIVFCYTFNASLCLTPQNIHTHLQYNEKNCKYRKHNFLSRCS